jgi:C-terminal processing protease CtpA/Prc
MGIRFQSESLSIMSVEPGLPASKAGIQAQDVIVRVGSLEPQSYEQVIAHVCSFRPGAVVEIEVKRGNERKVFKVKLGTRPPELDLSIPVPFDPPPP